MPNGLARSRYAEHTTGTASPQRLLTMLYDRLIGDLAIAEAAMRTKDFAAVGNRVQHAQDIILELWGSLDTQTWPEGEGLKSLYLWMISELNSCRIPPDPERILAVREMLEPLRDTWKQALTLEASNTPSSVG